MATGSFGTASGGINNNKAQALKAMALNGTRGIQTFTDAQNQINQQGASALAEAQNGQVAPAPAGLDAELRARITGPTQQRSQALTQAGALYQGDLDRARASVDNYSTEAQAQIPVMQKAYENKRGLAAQAWDQYMQLQAEKQALAASGGGGGGRGGGTSAAAKPLSVGPATNLLQGAAGQARSADVRALVNSADQLLAGPGSAQQYEQDLTNQYYDMPLAAPKPAVVPAETDYGTNYENQIYALQGGAPLSSAPALDDASIHAQAYNYLQALNAHGATAPNTVNAQGQLQHGGYVPSDAEVDQTMGQLRGGTLYPGNFPAPPQTPEQAARVRGITQREQKVGQLVNQLIGPQSRQGPYSSPAYSPYNPFVPQFGGAAYDTANAPLGDYLGPAMQIAADQGYNLGVYNDPLLAAGLFPDVTPAEREKDANTRASAQQQALTDAGKLSAQQNYFGTTDPTQLGYLSTLAGLQTSAASSARGQESSDRAAASEQQRALTADTKAQQDQQINEVVGAWLDDVQAGDKEATPEALYNALITNGVPARDAASVAASVAGSATTLTGG